MPAEPATPELARRLKTRELAAVAFEEVERRYRMGTPFELAKQAVLDEQVPAVLAEHGPEVADDMVRTVMDISLTGISPYVRRQHRDRRWKRLAEANAATGGAPPTRLERLLFDWLGQIPRRMRP